MYNDKEALALSLYNHLSGLGHKVTLKEIRDFFDYPDGVKQNTPFQTQLSEVDKLLLVAYGHDDIETTAELGDIQRAVSRGYMTHRVIVDDDFTDPLIVCTLTAHGIKAAKKLENKKP